MTPARPPATHPAQDGARRLGVGVIGCGRIAERVHLPALARLAGARVAAVADPDPARRRVGATLAPGARSYPDHDTLLADAAIDAVVIATPPGHHAAIAVAAFEAGKAVYVEKPLATSVEEGDRVVAAWRRAGTTGMVGFNYRHGPLQRSLRELLASGRVGPTTAVRTTFTAASRPLPEWLAAPGAVLAELGSHHVDLVRYLFGEEVAEVRAELGPAGGHTAMVRMRLTGGLPVQSLFSLRATDEDAIEVFGRDGKLWLERYTSTRVAVEPATYEYGRVPQLGRAWRALRRGVREAVRRPGEPSYGAALAAFVDGALAGDEVEPTLEDGLRALAVVAAMETSAASGAWVPVEPCAPS